MKIISKTIKQKTCRSCNGKRGAFKWYKYRELKRKWIPCDVCDGTGIYKEEAHYLIDEKHKIGFSVDQKGK